MQRIWASFVFFGSYFFFGEISVNQRVLLQLDLGWLKTALNSHEKCNEFVDLLFSRPSLQIILPIERLFVLCHSLIRSLYFIQVYVMFNKRAGVFYRGIGPRGASLLKDFKNIPGKACLNGVDNNDAFVNVGN